MYKEGLGNIHLQWGRPGHSFPILKADAKGFEQKVSHTDGYGLSHILAKHDAKTLKLLPEIIQRGRVSFDKSNPVKVIIHHQGSLMVLSKDNVSSSYVITSFDVNEKKSKMLKQVRGEVKDPAMSKVRQKRIERRMKNAE